MRGHGDQGKLLYSLIENPVVVQGLDEQQPLLVEHVVRVGDKLPGIVIRHVDDRVSDVHDQVEAGLEKLRYLIELSDLDGGIFVAGELLPRQFDHLRVRVEAEGGKPPLCEAQELASRTAGGVEDALRFEITDELSEKLLLFRRNGKDKVVVIAQG